MDGKKAQYLATGVGLGAAFGIILGLLLFPDNIALGLPLGIGIGLIIGAAMAQRSDDDD